MPETNGRSPAIADPAPPGAMTAADVRGALCRRWPDSEYLNIYEAPNDSARQGRKLDVLVLSLWASRGHELDGVEIKVSASDWKRELDNAAKADWWWEHVHRFWVAVPAPLGERVRSELPTGWGLLTVTRDDKPKVVVKAEKHTPKPMTWPALVGIMRASADAGFNALSRAEQRGYDRGYDIGLREGKRQTAGGHVQRQFEELTKQVRTYRDVTGIDLLTDSWRDDAAEIGEAVKALMHYRLRPAAILDHTRRHAAQLRTKAKDIDDLANELAKVLTPKSDLQLTLSASPLPHPEGEQ